LLVKQAFPNEVTLVREAAWEAEAVRATAAAALTTEKEVARSFFMIEDLWVKIIILGLLAMAI
jgi:hypothetical protein